MTDRYEIIEPLLGEDVLGKLYLAEDAMLMRRVIVRSIEHGKSEGAKKRSDKWRKKFAKYTGKMSTMQHPNLLTMYDISLNDEGVNVVYQYVESESLDSRLERGSISQFGVYNMVSDMLEALHAAHDAEVFHGAIHTGSVRRIHRASGGYRYLLVDLGLNQLVSMIKGGRVRMADPVLLAPELHAEDSKPDAKADLFMLGQLCYTALLGGHPYSDKSDVECEELYVRDGMPHISHYLEGIHPEFANWIMQLVESAPEKRPDSIEHAMTLLAEIQQDELVQNIPSESGAVAEVVGNTALQVSGTVTTQAVVPMTGQQGIRRIDLNEREAKEKKVMACVIGALSLALLIGGILLGVKASAGDSQKGEETAVVLEEMRDDVPDVDSRESSIELGEGELVSTVLQEDNPVKIDLDNDRSLDWLVSMGVPIHSKYETKGTGYFEGVEAFGVESEKTMVRNPIRFMTDDRELLPRATMRTGSGAKVGSGYEIKLRIPEGGSQSVLVDLYVVQKGCDVRLEVYDHENDLSKITSLQESDSGVFRVPLEISNPTGNEVYTMKVVVSKIGKTGKIQLSLCGLVVNLDQD